ncbi:hypothetical protein Agabi119p4_9073 [Agaricus bisporus var. burnettii]|uniref:Uncharacterized protein n=1 Tax=Agaricus bisporus var. burnettii TaxID=192524 RepID=A0A8H7C5S3_AGABI|nr:hypothetical protein Agabi119p4_9073 [Agaricus bisporus var. burnettii]
MSFLPHSRTFADHARTRLPLSHAIPKNRLKNPGRGGKNLGNRYRVLERSLRGKLSLSLPAPQTTTTILPTRPAPSRMTTFKGFVVPIQPLPPHSDGTNVACRDALSVSMTFTKSPWRPIMNP